MEYSFQASDHKDLPFFGSSSTPFPIQRNFQPWTPSRDFNSCLAARWLDGNRSGAKVGHYWVWTENLCQKSFLDFLVEKIWVAAQIPHKCCNYSEKPKYWRRWNFSKSLQRKCLHHTEVDLHLRGDRWIQATQTSQWIFHLISNFLDIIGHLLVALRKKIEACTGRQEVESFCFKDPLEGLPLFLRDGQRPIQE